MATIHHFVVTLADGAVTRYAQSIHGYDEGENQDFLRAHGFTEVTFRRSLAGERATDQGDFFALVARK